MSWPYFFLTLKCLFFLLASPITTFEVKRTVSAILLFWFVHIFAFDLASKLRLWKSIQALSNLCYCRIQTVNCPYVSWLFKGWRHEREKQLDDEEENPLPRYVSSSYSAPNNEEANKERKEKISSAEGPCRFSHRLGSLKWLHLREVVKNFARQTHGNS